MCNTVVTAVVLKTMQANRVASIKKVFYDYQNVNNAVKMPLNENI
jgi:hypothetical protein